ncbi:TetR/AcrR family transcriptional regulator [Paenibacillus alkalitolerans]|uniref:TetR/AcrR family transcriptional regulator n=1 Tax=Paenibacillus alkalitolerans TaxID=2799335 RepID=UPI0018F294CC|nr:TetR/AcrR family transcriptional regulator [Paenibacillus alkalitolerans]
MARRAVEQELSRERILFAARELFVTHGYRAVSMRKIAQELGYSHGSIYYYFQDKADLFYALVVEDFNLLISKQSELLLRIQRRDMDALKQLMFEFIRFGLENPHHYEIMFLIRDSELQRFSRSEQAKSLDLFASVVRDAVTKHPNREHLQFTLPWNLFMALHGFISYCIHFGQSFEEVKPLAEQHVALLCRALETGGSADAEAGYRDIAETGVSIRIVG